ncbi:MAG TPA: hypothetical protein VMM13_00775 [Euzebya sp.]|nr:hypothetical protein [Euzebya sp.]
MLQLDQPDGSRFRLSRLTSDAVQEELQPRHDVAVLAGEEEMVVVLAAVLLEEADRYISGSDNAPRSTSINGMSNRPIRPLPSRNGWMTSNW